MKKQFIIYDFSSNSFFASLNEQGIVWSSQPMLFDSQDEADNTLNDSYNSFPSDFDNRLINVMDIYVTEQKVANK
jgi:hypothetical protein